MPETYAAATPNTSDAGTAHPPHRMPGIGRKAPAPSRSGGYGWADATRLFNQGRGPAHPHDIRQTQYLKTPYLTEAAAFPPPVSP